MGRSRTVLDDGGAQDATRRQMEGQLQGATFGRPSRLPELPEGWCWATVGQLIGGIQAGKNFKCIERPPTAHEVGVVKVSAVSWGSFAEGASKTCANPALVNPRLFIEPGDFLFSRANTIELVGACVIVEHVTKRLMLSDKILRLRVLAGVDRWLLWNLRSSWGRRQIESLATGNQESMRNIGQERIAQIRVPLPPPAEQARITTAIEDIESLTLKQLSTVRDNRRRCQRLRQSILKWAFEGKLIDQDPNDEPASALLERIRAEQAAATSARPKHRRPGRKRSAA